MGGDDQALKPRFVLPSFKDVQQRGSEKSRLQSAFRQVGSANTSAAQPGSGAQELATFAPTRNACPPPGSASSSACAPVAPRPAGFPAQHSIQRENEATGLAPSVPPNASAHPQQPDNRQSGACVAANVAPTTAPLQPSNRAHEASAAYSRNIGQGNAILVNRNQQGNPVLKHIRNANYRFADVVPDFQFNDQVSPSGVATN
jgi:hypothetical protein